MWYKPVTLHLMVMRIRPLYNLGMTITKTYLYNFDPLKPHFYIVKLGFTGVYITFLISAQKHRLWILVKTASSSTHNLCFEQKYEKYQAFISENFQFLVVKFSIYLNRRVFVMSHKSLCSTCDSYSLTCTGKTGFSYLRSK